MPNVLENSTNFDVNEPFCFILFGADYTQANREECIRATAFPAVLWAQAGVASELLGCRGTPDLAGVSGLQGDSKLISLLSDSCPIPWGLLRLKDAGKIMCIKMLKIIF